MMRHLTMLVLTYAACSLDAGSSGWRLPLGTAPQCLLLVAAVALLMFEGAGAVFWAACIGLLSDALSRGPLGLDLVLLANLAFFGQMFGIHRLRGSLFAGGAVVWVFGTSACLGGLLLRSLLDGGPIDMLYFGQYAAGRAGGSLLLFLSLAGLWRVVGGALRLVLPSSRVGGRRAEWAAPGSPI